LTLRRSDQLPRRLDEIRRLRLAGRYRAASRRVNRLARRHPEHTELSELRGDIACAAEIDRARRLLRDGPEDAAEALLRDIPRRCGEHPDPYLLLAALLVARGDNGDGARAAERAILSRPNAATFFRAAGLIRWSDRHRARQCLDEAKRLIKADDAGNRFLYVPELLALEGGMMFEDGETAQGLALLERAFDLAPASTGMAADLADAYAFLDRKEDARSVVDTALKDQRRDPRLLALSRRLGSLPNPSGSARSATPRCAQE
jgi:tetratricopeptide (TPR) repeat protein